MANLRTFGEYLRLEADLVDLATKQDLLQSARLLAFNLAHYEMKFGEIPLDDVLATLASDQPNEDQVELLNRGMQNLIGMLGNQIQGLDDKTLN